MSGPEGMIFRFFDVWSSGFTFLLVLSLLAALALIGGSALAWVFFLLFGVKGDVSLEWSALFAALIAPYIFGGYPRVVHRLSVVHGQHCADPH